jgi:protein-disulfide isomerase
MTLRAFLAMSIAIACAGACSAAEPGATLIDVGGSPSTGNSKAKLVLVEFADYQCPFCGRFARGTLPQIRKEYVETGKLRLVFRNLPFEGIHAQAFQAHVGALCAGDQGQYWAMHDRLFDNPRELDSASLLARARAIGLDATKFQVCLGSGRHDAQIRADIAAARALGFDETPSFYLATTTADPNKVSGVRPIVGARPFTYFQAAIEELLAAR